MKTFLQTPIDRSQRLKRYRQSLSYPITNILRCFICITAGCAGGLVKSVYCSLDYNTPQLIVVIMVLKFEVYFQSAYSFLPVTTIFAQHKYHENMYTGGKNKRLSFHTELRPYSRSTCHTFYINCDIWIVIHIDN